MPINALGNVTPAAHSACSNHLSATKSPPTEPASLTPAPRAVGALAVADAEESALDRATTLCERPPVVAL